MIVFGVVVLIATTVHKPIRLSICGEITMTGRLFVISGVLNPEKSQITIEPLFGWYLIATIFLRQEIV
jgi:hypothetical protein